MKHTKLIANVSFVAACFLLFSHTSQVSFAQSEQEQIIVKIQAEKIDARITNVSVKQEGEKVVIKGVVRRTKETKGPLPVGCVDTNIIDHHGKIIDKAHVMIPSSGTYENGAVENKFTLHVPTMAETVRQVNVKYHNGPHNF